MDGLFSSRQIKSWTMPAVDRAGHARFFRAMLARGVLLPPSAFESGFLSLAHDEELVDQTLEAARESFAEARS
jgi:glutamate-1-semialdehyde 2,1-aminomutase